MEALRLLFEKILDALLRLLRPKNSGGQVLVFPIGTTNPSPKKAMINVPDDWADSWTIYIEPSDDYVMACRSATTKILRAKLTVGNASGGSTRHNITGLILNEPLTVYSNPGSTVRWLDVPILGEAFHVSGRSVEVEIFCSNDSTATGISGISVSVSIAKGKPKARKKAVSWTLTDGQNNPLSIPLYAKSFHLLMLSSGESLANITNLDCYNQSLNAVFSFTNLVFSNEVNMLAKNIAFDSAGVISYMSKMTNEIYLRQDAVALNATVTNPCEALAIFSIEE